MDSLLLVLLIFLCRLLNAASGESCRGDCPRDCTCSQTGTPYVINCTDVVVTKKEKDWLTRASQCADSMTLQLLSLKFSSAGTPKHHLVIPWSNIITKPGIDKLDLYEVSLMCDCENAWIHWFDALKLPSIMKGPEWDFDCPECSFFSTHMILGFPKSLRKPRNKHCSIRGQNGLWRTMALSIFVESKCRVPQMEIKQREKLFSCSLKDSIDSGVCISAQIRSFFKKLNFESSLITSVTKSFICEDDSLSIDTTNGSTVDSGWLMCTLNSSHIPSVLIRRIAIHDAPAVLQVLTYRGSKKDFNINITVASAEHIEVSWFYFAGQKQNAKSEIWEIVPGMTNQFLLSTHKEGFYGGWMTTVLSASFRDPDVKCIGGNYLVRLCNSMGCTSQTLHVNTSRPRIINCAIANKTLMVTNIFRISEENATENFSLKNGRYPILMPDKDDGIPDLPRPGIDTPSSYSYLIYITICLSLMLGTCIIMLGVCLIIFIMRKRQVAAARKEMLHETEGREEIVELKDWRRHGAKCSLQENISYVTYMRPLKDSTEVVFVPCEKIQIVRQLGEGAFGCVYLVETSATLSVRKKSTSSNFKSEISGGNCASSSPLLHPSGQNMNNNLMAMKLLKSIAPDKVADLKREACFLTQLNDPNIVKFYGISSFQNQGFALLFEFMENGDLVHYLRDHNPDLLDSKSANKALEYKDLLVISYQVVSGLAYLVDNFLVHRDLAARNCLVAANGTVKLSDFGMTRDLYVTDYYKMGAHTLVPLRWLPPESVLYRKFTTESDMWSFGVLCYEIWSYGQVPWYAYSNSEVMDIVKSGRILEKPDYCPVEMYNSLITGCCQVKAADRPTAREVKNFLEEMLERDMNYCSITASASDSLIVSSGP